MINSVILSATKRRDQDSQGLPCLILPRSGVSTVVLGTDSQSILCTPSDSSGLLELTSEVSGPLNKVSLQVLLNSAVQLGTEEAGTTHGGKETRNARFLSRK